MLDWIFEGIVTWISSIVSEMMDAVSGLFLDALGTDMTAMEEYFPFVTKAFTIMQYTAWAVLFLITVWQLFRVFGGPVTEAENPWTLLARSSMSALLIGYAKPIFQITLNIATAPYTALMEVKMKKEDFTFVGVENALKNGLTTIISIATVVGLLLLVILMIALGWNYFKLLLETVERYIVVGVLCYTSPLAFSMGASKTTVPVFKSWCRMVGSQLLLLVMNVWFLRGFSISVGQYVGNGGELSNGNGRIFLWLFCAIAFLKTAQKFDSYLAAMGLNVAQTGSGMGLELMMAARAVSGLGSGARSAGSVFGGGSSAAATGAGAAAAGFASKFKGNSYVRDAVVDGGVRMGAGGGLGFVGRAFGGIAARNGATLTSDSISSVASRNPKMSGTIGGEIADKSLANYMPQLKGVPLKDTKISGGKISTTAMVPNGKMAELNLYDKNQFEKPEGPSALVEASDGVDWYAMRQNAQTPAFESGELADDYNQSQFQAFMPGYEQQVSSVDGSRRLEGQVEVQHEDGSGTRFYDTSQYAVPRGDYQVYEDSRGGQWYAIHGEASVDRKPVYEDGKPVYDGDSVRTVSVESVRYRSTPERYDEPRKRDHSAEKSPRRKN